MSKIEYCIDSFYDAFVLWGMLHSDDPAGRENRIKSMNISKEIADAFINAKEFEKIETYALQYMEKRHAEHSVRLEKARETYQKEWDRINNHFFEKTKEITSASWEHDLYYVVVSPIHKGISSMGGDTVVRSAFEDPKNQLRITAHELLMSHIWTVLWKVVPESKKDTFRTYWAVNELIANAILGLDPFFKDLWTKKTRGYDQYLTNYPQLNDLKTLIKEIYLSKHSFGDFVNLVCSRVRSSKLG